MFIAISTLHFPSDSEFKQGFLIKDAYNFNRCKYLLHKLENCGREEPTSIENYTIEHVMPQKLPDEWKAELGNDGVRCMKNTYTRLATSPLPATIQS